MTHETPREPAPDASSAKPDPTDLRGAFSAAARRAGIGQVPPGEAPSARALLKAVGGVRGLIESILPGLTFLVVYTITRDLLPSVLIPLVVAVAFVVVRAVTRSPVMTAVAGVLGIAVSAALALLTGRAEDNFVPGFFINAISLTVILISLAVRWPLIGVIVGVLTGEGAAWREDRAKRRVMTVATVLWAAMFALRLAVQVPLYFAGATEWLAGTKLLMGVPLYAVFLWVTWLLVRAAYGRSARS
ncbi:DUF3159 domain-containing protein [Lysobacter korlensis]|uniref:DUF3159 domain-containing protein n=1 Tax=Lysobacter korlensis TaxID=553636 RepID=A0ABV6RM87_9GAMM